MYKKDIIAFNVLIVLIVMTVLFSFPFESIAAEKKGALIKLKEKFFNKESDKDLEANEAIPRENAAPAEAKPEVTVPEKDIPETKKETPVLEKEVPELPFEKNEIIDRIKGVLDSRPEIAQIVPNISIQENNDGVKEYFYVSGENESIALEEMDKTVLFDLMLRINNELNRINTERVLRQIQQQQNMIRQIQQQQQQQQNAPVIPPAPPRVYVPPQVPTPPRIPQVPPTPPSAVRIPSPPPVPPQPNRR